MGPIGIVEVATIAGWGLVAWAVFLTVRSLVRISESLREISAKLTSVAENLRTGSPS
jgi:hypothetical protein